MSEENYYSDFNNNTWIKNGHSFFDISSNKIISLKTRKSHSEELFEMAENYYYTAYNVADHICENQTDNALVDAWTLSCIYMFRQAIELLIKSGISKKSKTSVAMEIFQKSSHSLIKLYNELIGLYSTGNLQTQQHEWLKKYFQNIEDLDSKSDLFRYPINMVKTFGIDDFDIFGDVEDVNIDQYAIFNKFSISYCFAYKIIFNKDKDKDKDKDEEYDISNYEATLFDIAPHGMGYCSLCGHLWKQRDDFYMNIEGFSEVGIYLLKKMYETNENKFFFPACFMFRNAIELTFKRFLVLSTEIKLKKEEIKKVEKSHRLKDIWSKYRFIVERYAKKMGSDLDTLEIVDAYIFELDSIDKNSDAFRYPCNKSFEFYFKDKDMDYINAIRWLGELFNFFDSCYDMMDDMLDYENESKNNSFF
ncbi:hypothetical protein [Chryseobacterium sp.]|uniref:hypothetical protein n=1 Tax=Chryseobacterium sp. TaxID=1871047 RepID=UPI002FC5FED9